MTKAILRVGKLIPLDGIGGSRALVVLQGVGEGGRITTEGEVVGGVGHERDGA